MNVLVTGGSGVIGRRVVSLLAESSGFNVTFVSRGDHSIEGASCLKVVSYKDFDWSSALVGIDAVIHLAGYAHKVLKTQESVVEAYNINVLGTLNLINSCVKANIKSFIYISSINVADIKCSNGKQRPKFDLVAFTKVLVETKLDKLRVMGVSGFTTIRPGLVYGSNMKGNFHLLLKLSLSPLGLFTLKECRVRREMIFVDNLVGYILALLSERGLDSGGANTVVDPDVPNIIDFSKEIRRSNGLRVVELPFVGRVACKLIRLFKMMPTKGNQGASECYLKYHKLNGIPFKSAVKTLN